MFFDSPEQAFCFLQHCILSGEEFAKLLLACAPSREEGQLDERIIAGNRAMLLLLYDTGIQASELVNLRIKHVDRKHELILVKGQGAKQRRIALGQNCLHNLLYYLDAHRLTLAEFIEKGRSGEDHVFLSEKGRPITESEVLLLFATLKKRAGITGKCIHLSTFRDTFAVRYLELSHDASSLQQLLGEEDMAAIHGYMQMSEASTRIVMPKDPLDDYVSRLPESDVIRRRAFRVKKQERGSK